MSLSLLTQSLFLVSAVYSQALFYEKELDDGDEFMSFELTITPTKTKCTMVGPDGYWLGLGFGNTNMDNTYSVIYDSNGLVEKDPFRSGGGSTITPCNNGTESCLTLISAESDGTTLTVMWERDSSPSDVSGDVFHVFDSTATELKMIWGLAEGTYTKHTNKGSLNAVFTEALYYEEAVLDGSVFMDFELLIMPNKTRCTMYGNAGYWLGVGFGDTNMDNTYSVIYDEASGLVEKDPFRSGGGSTITPCNNGAESCLTLVSAIEDDTTLTVTWERDNDPSDVSGDVFYVFDNTVTSIKMIWGLREGNYAQHSNRGNMEIDLTEVSYEETLLDGDEVFMSFELTITATTTTCTMTGPDGYWLGLGFGSTSMDNTYSVIYDSNGLVEKDPVKDSTGGSTITPCNSGTESCLRLISAESDGTTLTVVWQRDNDPSDVSGDVFHVFENSESDLDMTWGLGSGTYSKHSHKGSLSASPVSTETDTDTDTNIDTSAVFTLEDFEIEDVDMMVSMTISADEMEITLTGPDDRWFGLAWNGHFDGDALIYTSGVGGSADEDAHDCHLVDQTTSGTNNGIDDQEDWTIDSVVDNGDGTRTFTARRSLTTDDDEDSDFEFPPSATEYLFAHGSSSSMELSYHAGNRVSLSIDLELGTVTVIEAELFTVEQHALEMFLAFGIFMPWGALTNRFLGFSLCSKISFFRSYAHLSVQLHKAMMMIAWVFALIGFLTKVCDSAESSESLHGLLGWITFFFFTFLLAGSVAGQKVGKIVPRHENTGDNVAINGHRVFGTVFVLFGMFMIVSGLNERYGEGATELTIYIVYVVIVLVVWLAFEVYGCMNADSMNKALVNNGSDETLPIVFDTSEGQVNSPLSTIKRPNSIKIVNDASEQPTGQATPQQPQTTEMTNQ